MTTLTLSSFFTAMTLSVALTTGAWAVDLKNLDDKAYTVSVEEDGDVYWIEVAAYATVEDVCRECILSILGTDLSFDAFEGETILIEGGKLDIPE
jgi:hypothetical protein